MTELPEIYSIAFTLLKIPSSLLLGLEERGITREDFFRLDVNEILQQTGYKGNKEFLSRHRREEAILEAHRQWDKMKKHKIKVVSIFDNNYPVRLLNTPDPPVSLYILGDYKPDASHTLSMVGTRRPTHYGLSFCEKFIKETGEYFPDLSIVSGLAYGIDAAAHKAALKENLHTIAVVAHGLDMIYPAQNRLLAAEILRKGGAIFSEYLFGTKPYKPHFLERNRIVAGLSDVTVIVESNIKGGAMSTANYAFSYSRDVMALPGRAGDELSRGCNHLIRKQKAQLLTCTADVIETTGWQPLNLNVAGVERNLFPELEGEAKIIYDYLRYCNEPVQTDKLLQICKIPVSNFLSILNELEFEGIIVRYPGNRYALS